MNKRIFSVISIFLTVFLPFLVVSCSFNEEKEGFFPNNKNKQNISEIEPNILAPIPLENKIDYVSKIESIFSEFFNGSKINIDYSISYENNEMDYFQFGNDIYITALKTSNLLYSNKPMRKVVDFISLTTYENEIDICKPRTNEKISESLIIFSKCIENIIKNVYLNSDYTITYEAKQDDIWSKNDTIYVNYIASSEILRGTLQLKLVLVELSSIDFSDIIPRNNQTKEQVIDKYIDRITKSSRNAQINLDYYIEIDMKNKVLKEGDTLQVKSNPNSNMVTGESEIFIVKTFNINEIEKEFRDLNYGYGSLEDKIVNEINSLIYSSIPEAIEYIDYIIEIKNDFSVLYPQSQVIISPLESSEYIIGSPIILETPKLDINFVKEEFSNIPLVVGVTNKQKYIESINMELSKIFTEVDISSELEFDFSKNKNIVVGDEEIIISPSANSKLFVDNNQKIIYKTSMYESNDLKIFLDQFLFAGGENSIDITAGLTQEQVKDIINSLLSMSPNFQMLKEGIDYQIEFEHNDKYLWRNEKIEISINENSNYISGEMFYYNATDYDFSVISTSLNDLNIKEGFYKNDINEIFKDYFLKEIPFIEYEKDIELKYIRNNKSNCLSNKNACIGEDSSILTQGEEIEIVLKENDKLTLIDQKIKVDTVKSTNNYIDMSCLNINNQIKFVGYWNSKLYNVEINLMKKLISMISDSQYSEIAIFNEYLNKLINISPENYKNFVNIDWYSNLQENWIPIEENSSIYDGKQYMAKIQFKDEFINQFLEDNFKVFNSTTILVDVEIDPLPDLKKGN